MTSKPITLEQKDAYNQVVTHPLQSYEWGEFREKEGLHVIRRGIYDGEKLKDGFQLTLHPIPGTPFTIGYLPKGTLPTPLIIKELKQIGKEQHCLFIQLEPNVLKTNVSTEEISSLPLRPAAHPLFTKFTFLLDLTQSEEAILAAMHPKTRYNIRVAQKHGVVVKEDNSPEAFDAYLQLTEETTKRQGFYAHSRHYHQLQWQQLAHTTEPHALTSHLFTASYQGSILTTWMVFVFNHTLYYPYGASSSEHRESMHSTLMMWEVIRYGKAHDLTLFDMWGAANQENPPQSDPYYGFHRFKQNFGPVYTEFMGSFDLVINPFLYQGFKLTNKARWAYLKLRT